MLICNRSGVHWSVLSVRSTYMYMKTFNLHQMANYYPPYNQVFFFFSFSFGTILYSHSAHSVIHSELCSTTYVNANQNLTGPVSTGDNPHPEAIGLRQTKHSTTGAVRRWVSHGHSRQADVISHIYSDGFREIYGVSYNERTNNIELFFFFWSRKI